MTRYLADLLPDECPECGHDGFMCVDEHGRLVGRADVPVIGQRRRGTWVCEACDHRPIEEAVDEAY